MTESAPCSDLELGQLLSAYEVGQLSSPERLTFERHLLDCPACQEDLYAMAQYTVTLRSEAGRVLQALHGSAARGSGARAASVLTAAPARDRGRSASDSLRGWLGEVGAWRWLVPIGAAAVVAAVFLLPQSDRHSPLGQLAILDPLPYVTIETRSLGGWELYATGMSAYSDQRYREAAEQLRLALDDSGAFDPVQADQARLYLGISLLLSDETGKAMAVLELASRSSMRVISDRSRWYLAQAGLVQGDALAARRYLESLVESPGYGDEAKTQLQGLERWETDSPP